MRNSRWGWCLLPLSLAFGCGSSSSTSEVPSASGNVGANASGGRGNGGSGANGGSSANGGSNAKGGNKGGITGIGGASSPKGTPIPTPPPSCKALAAPRPAVAKPTLRATLAGSWDENWLASPALVDLDGDGKKDIVAPRHSVLYAYRSDGSLLWQTAWGSSASSTPEHGSVRMWPSAAVGDFDGDGDPEIAVSAHPDDSGHNVAVYDHRGQLLPGWPQAFGAAEVRSIAAADVDGDGALEVLINKQADGPATQVFKLDGRSAPGWPQVGEPCAAPRGDCIDYGGFNQNIGAGDFDGDGVPEVVSTYDAIGFGIFRGNGSSLSPAPGFADAWITGVEAYHDLALSKQGWGKGDRSEFTYSPPVVADIDGDGAMELVLGGDHEHSESTANRGISVWVLNGDLTRPLGWETPKDSGPPLVFTETTNIVPTYPAPAVGDLDAAPGLEIVIPAYDGLMYAYRSNGEVLWTHAFGASDPYVGASEALIADLNGDGSPEVVFSTFSGGEPRKPLTPAHLVVLDAGGNLLHKVELSGRGSMAAPSVGDLEGDGTLELVISLKDSLGGKQGGVQIWNLPGASDNCVLWGTGRGGPLRQGNVPKPPQI